MCFLPPPPKTAGVIKRLFDLLVAIPLLVLCVPFMLLISLAIAMESRGGVFYVQRRVGRGGRDFTMYKFRTMKPGAERQGRLTVGNRDGRITRTGYFLRKYKLDELPQLFNVLHGTMSLVGPRPEVREYVDLYTDDQRRVLSVKPGITDYASIAYADENELLAASSDPGKTYVREIMPRKLALGLQYIDKKSLLTDLRILFRTVARVLFRK